MRRPRADIRPEPDYRVSYYRAANDSSEFASASTRELDNGFDFFSGSTPPAARKRRIIFVVILIIASASLVWPVYVPFGGIRPFVLGLPLSMAWVAFWIVAMFGAMVWLYRSEED